MPLFEWSPGLEIDDYNYEEDENGEVVEPPIEENIHERFLPDNLEDANVVSDDEHSVDSADAIPIRDGDADEHANVVAADVVPPIIEDESIPSFVEEIKECEDGDSNDANEPDNDSSVHSDDHSFAMENVGDSDLDGNYTSPKVTQALTYRNHQPLIV